MLFCAAGKTEIFFEILKRNPGRSLIILNQIDLLDQTEKRIKAALPDSKINIFCGSRKKDKGDAAVTLGTIQSILNKENLDYSQIILDEVHAVNWEDQNNYYSKLLNKFSSAKVFGFTATPFRNNGLIYGPGKFFSKITYEKSIKEGIAEGWLVPPILKGSEFRFDTSNLRTVLGDFDKKDIEKLVKDSSKQVRDAYLKTMDRKKIIWFCSSIEHAEAVRLQIPEEATTLHSKLNKKDRAENKKKFETTNCRHLVFVTVIAQGYDYPALDAVVILRPTRSATLYIQVAGRALRLCEGKKDALILDYGRVIESLGPLDNPIILEPAKRKKGDPPLEAPSKQCPGCFLIIPLQSLECPECKFKFKKNETVLSSRPEESRAIISSSGDGESPEIRVNIFKIIISDHVTMKGHPCYKVEYFSNLIYSKTEYIMKWNNKVLLKRLEYFQDFGLSYQSKMPQELKLKPTLNIIFENTKYGLSVKGIERVGHRDTDSNVAKSAG